MSGIPQQPLDNSIPLCQPISASSEDVKQNPIVSKSFHLNDKNPNAPSNLFHCPGCNRLLEKQFFRKKDLTAYYKNKTSDKTSLITPTVTINNRNDTNTKLPLCHSCKRADTAKRCKQPPPAQLRQNRRGESGIKRRPNNFGYCDYVDRLFSMRCFADIVNLGVFSSAKDVSESMGSIQAATQFGNIDKNSTKIGNIVLCLCIGDGSTPRTAVLVSFMKRGWWTVSIDPNLNQEWEGTNDGVKGMMGYKGKLEDFMTEPVETHVPSLKVENPADQKTIQHLVLLCVHSHVQFREGTRIEFIRKRYSYPRTTLVSIPCCPKYRHAADVQRVANHTYEDDCIFSACRKVS
eukprot:CAMPEP_0113304572 /NCGR_PEP_ID=MMETSP0010_2-20120614/4540_1 /TAXON_ID=216773 ORGANISM="Corethron hystrix, Strain 308" /NCGR_SAMPLE_ID=MMETSP0010_2 /ASSEMBLY_ACC=CAM_ASM_000155 /LENGTH=347 /DNA_ID=CAMNT_0000158807 /DNA_START=201 /DNA_END=1241 /DNA_ORIENTATION=- /assembly_acc=CAM_ASM_000155